LTEEQKTASREACVNQKRSCGSVNMSWSRTRVSKVAVAPVVAAKAPAVAQDVEMVDAGVARLTAGIASLGYGGLKPASRKPVCHD
jgi:hypothetical protein